MSSHRCRVRLHSHRVQGLRRWVCLVPTPERQRVVHCHDDCFCCAASLDNPEGEQLCSSCGTSILTRGSAFICRNMFLHGEVRRSSTLQPWLAVCAKNLSCFSNHWQITKVQPRFHLSMQARRRKYNPSSRLVLRGCARASTAARCRRRGFDFKWDQVIMPGSAIPL